VETRPDTDVARLVMSCPDGPGIIAAVSTALAEAGANIINSAQFSTDPEGGTFFLRLEFHREQLAERLPEIEERLRRVGADFTANVLVTPASRRKRVALFVSRYDHCLLDLLWRWQRGELPMDIVAVVSNHPDLETEVSRFRVPYVHIPVTRETKPEAERRQLELLAGKVDLVVMARYMQILSAAFLEGVGAPVINIHHSFLPAFAGAGPYARAHARGVKLIGATAHYATVDLDEGPIIEQDVQRVSHRHDADSLERIGRDIERLVLAKAVDWHLQDRVMVHENRTIVFH
jgi:formyltetrahydrofolate deformylase